MAGVLAIVTQFGVDVLSHDWECRSDSRVGVKKGQCPIQSWIASRFERGHSPIASRFNWDKEVTDSGLVWFLLDNELSTCSMV